MKWSEGTLNNNNKDLDRFKLLKMLLKLPVTKYSRDLKLKKISVVLKKSFKKT